MKMFSPTNSSTLLVPRLGFHHTFAYLRNNISANILHLLLSLHLARSWFSRHGKRACAECLFAKLWAHARLILVVEWKYEGCERFGCRRCNFFIVMIYFCCCHLVFFVVVLLLMIVLVVDNNKNNHWYDYRCFY